VKRGTIREFCTTALALGVSIITAGILLEDWEVFLGALIVCEDKVVRKAALWREASFIRLFDVITKKPWTP